jgi:hypothetical protein
MKSLDELIAEDKQGGKKFGKYGGAGVNHSFNKKTNYNAGFQSKGIQKNKSFEGKKGFQKNYQ